MLRSVAGEPATSLRTVWHLAGWRGLEVHMRAVVQRVTSGAVRVDGNVVGAIGHGLLVYIGVAAGDVEADVAYVVDKVLHLRIFPDEAGKMNRDVGEAGGGILLVSAFTTQADARKGRRPSFDAAMPHEAAQALYERVAAELGKNSVTVQTGRYREHMVVDCTNDGPICILLDSRKAF
jgi:D-tyrosyl-tRNA(Tyr) deacylase